MVLTSTLAFLTTCCRSDSAALRTIDPDLAAYIIEFKAEMEQRGALPTWAPLPIAITYGYPGADNNGVAYLPMNVVIISERLRDLNGEYGEYERKSTIFHELVHAVGMVRRHSDDPGSIMYYKHMPSDMSRWDEQMDELAAYIKKYSPIYQLMIRLEQPVETGDDF